MALFSGSYATTRKLINAMAEEPKLSEEINRMRREPLLPVEKKLITWSLVLGLVLLVVLLWVSKTYFPATP